MIFCDLGSKKEVKDRSGRPVRIRGDFGDEKGGARTLECDENIGPSGVVARASLSPFFTEK